MRTKNFIIILIVLGIITFAAEGVAPNVFTAWNWLPLFISYVIFKTAKTSKSLPNETAAIGFLIGSMTLSLFFHSMWLFDIGGSKTGSSTSGLIFIFIPIYSIVPGIVGYFIGKHFGKRKVGIET